MGQDFDLLPLKSPGLLSGAKKDLLCRFRLGPNLDIPEKTPEEKEEGKKLLPNCLETLPAKGGQH